MVKFMKVLEECKMEEDERKTAITVSCSIKYIKKMRELGLSPSKIFDAGLEAKGVKDDI